MSVAITVLTAHFMLAACKDLTSTYPECQPGSPVRNALEMIDRVCPSQADPDACAERIIDQLRASDKNQGRENLALAESSAELKLPIAACNCRRPVYRPYRRWHRQRSSAARQRWSWHAVDEFVPPAPANYYNPLLPSTLDTAYDRAMVLHFRSPYVTDTDRIDPGWPPTPPVRGLFPYQARAWGATYQYDGLVGQYIRLSQLGAR